MSDNQKIKNKINKAISKLGNYHNGIPVDKILEILQSNGLNALNEDDTPYAAIFCGENAHTTIKTDNPKIYLYIAWYKMQSGRFEITSYVS